MSAILFNNRGHVISIGYNRRIIRSWKPTTVYRNRLQYISIHAEIDCLAGLTFNDTMGKYLYVHRHNNLLAKPCQKCEFVLKQFGLKKVFWSDSTKNYLY